MAQQDEQQQPGTLGKQVAEQMGSKLDADEAHRLATEGDDVYDAQALAKLEEKLKGEITGFNDIAQAADQLAIEKGKGMVQIFKANLPVFAVLIQHRTAAIVPAGQKTAVQNVPVTGGPDTFTFGSQPQPEFIKSLLIMATGGGSGLK